MERYRTMVEEGLVTDGIDVKKLETALNRIMTHRVLAKENGETKKQAQDLHDMVTGSSIVKRYSRNDKQWEVIDSRDLVPGDLVEVEPGTLHADLLLLQGTAIVNEAMLTGESAPEQKEPALFIFL